MADDYTMGSLAAQDQYDPNAIDWSRMNQPFGQLVDTNPVQHSAAGGLVQIRPSDIDQATAVALGASGGGLKTAPVPPKIGALADPTGGSGNWFIRHVGGEPVMTDEGIHGFSGLRTGKTPEQMSYSVKDAPQIDRKVFDIGDLEGQTMLFGVKDRTLGGGQLAEVGGRKLRSPINLEGGANYSYLHDSAPIPGITDPDVVRLFASVNQGAASKLNNEALRIANETGQAPLFTSMNMARGAGDSAKQTAQTAYQLTKQARPTDAAVSAVDNTMASILKANKITTDVPYPGLGSGKLGAWLDDAGLKARGAFVQALDTGKARAGGVPDIGEVRYANTDPRLRTTPTGSAGLFMGRTRPDLGTTTDTMHSNYGVGILGSKAERGGLAGSVPFHLIAPDIHRGLVAAGEPRFFSNNPASYIMTNMPAGMTKSQKITPEVVDNVSNFFRKYPAGYALAGAPALGALAAQDNYQPGGP